MVCRDYIFIYLSRHGLIAVRDAVMHHVGAKNYPEIAQFVGAVVVCVILDDVAKIRRFFQVGNYTRP